jgi:hypothetical protein
MVGCRAGKSGDFELRQVRSCYDLSPAKLFRWPRRRRIDQQPHDTYLKSCNFHSQHDAFRRALPFC